MLPNKEEYSFMLPYSPLIIALSISDSRGKAWARVYVIWPTLQRPKHTTSLFPQPILEVFYEVLNNVISNAVGDESISDTFIKLNLMYDSFTSPLS